MAKTSLPLTHGSVTQPRAGAGSSRGISWEPASASAPYLARAWGWQLLAEQSSKRPQGHRGSLSRQTPLLVFRENDVKYGQQILATSRRCVQGHHFISYRAYSSRLLVQSCSSLPATRYFFRSIQDLVPLKRSDSPRPPRIYAVHSKDTEPCTRGHSMPPPPQRPSGPS